jgi:ATP-dependent Clp protease adaptor protein ClpS
MKTSTQISEQQLTDTITISFEPYSLIVWNDEVNTFDWVIETLVEICHHSPEQAEQCAMFIHFKGKYAVKNGDYDSLKPLCDAITERGIGATVEEAVGR